MADKRSLDPTTQAPADGLSANPQDDWGEPADEGAVYSANHARRPGKTELGRGQGKLTRQAAKDRISRRA